MLTCEVVSFFGSENRLLLIGLFQHDHHIIWYELVARIRKKAEESSMDLARLKVQVDSVEKWQFTALLGFTEG